MFKREAPKSAKPRAIARFAKCLIRPCVEGLNSSLAQSAGESWRCKLFKNCKKLAHGGLKGLSDH